MSKANAPLLDFEPPPYAPPSYSTAVGGVPPQAPFPSVQPAPAAYYPPGQPPMGEKMGPPQAQYPAQMGQMGPPGQYPAGNPGGHPVQQINIVQAQPNVLPTTIITTVVPVGSQSTHMICPHCHAQVDTATKTSPSTAAYIWGVVLCLIGCDLGCCLIPCCMDDCMDVEHNCPNCKAFLGIYKR